MLLDRLGERYADVLAEERRLLRVIVREHGGFEIDSRADEFFAAFPEAADPVGAALAIQRRLRDHAWPDEATVRVQRIEARLPPGASTHRWARSA